MNARPATAEAACAKRFAAAPLASQASLAWAVAGLLATALLPLGGCRGAAYREVYQQKMANEIRVLEDQLYEADYHNQVLADEVERLKRKIAIPEASPAVRAERGERSEIADEALQPGGETASPPARSRQTPTPAPAPTPALPARPLPDASTRPDTSTLPDTGTAPEPPQVAIPPGAEELQIPDVDLGDPVPPGDPTAPAEPPPGQIQLPDSVQRLYRREPSPPVLIRINPGLSGGHRFDDHPEQRGVYLAIEAVDEQGRVVDLEDFEVQGELSVALLDPQREPAEARLGQWTFDQEDLRSMIRSHRGEPAAADRIDVYVRWEEKQPLGTHVIAHVRLSAEQTQLRAEAELPIAETALMQWSPAAGRR